MVYLVWSIPRTGTREPDGCALIPHWMHPKNWALIPVFGVNMGEPFTNSTDRSRNSGTSAEAASKISGFSHENLVQDTRCHHLPICWHPTSSFPHGFLQLNFASACCTALAMSRPARSKRSPKTPGIFNGRSLHLPTKTSISQGEKPDQHLYKAK